MAAAGDEQEIGYPDRHVAEMLDPVAYEEFYGLRKASGEYLSTIPRKTGYGIDENKKISVSSIFSLPTHSFVLDDDLASETGLKISSDSKDPEECNLMRNWLAKHIGKETDRHFILCCIPKTRKN